MKASLPILVLFTVINFSGFAEEQKFDLQGAWQLEEGDSEHSLIIQNGFFFHTNYSKSPKNFIFSQGGTYTLSDNSIKAEIYFNTENKEQVGTELIATYSIEDNNLVIDIDGERLSWKRVDKGTGLLAGIWRITGRMQDGKLTSIHQTGPRQTYKILSGNRFQWAAINPETKEFFGTGGGTYTFENGKYTENIEFFSRDNNRVGASLSFDGKLENGKWHHSGLSSKGEKIYEVWSTVK